MAFLSNTEKKLLPDLFALIVQCPEETQKYIYGYAQAVVDIMPKENDRRSSEKGGGSTDPAMV